MIVCLSVCGFVYELTHHLKCETAEKLIVFTDMQKTGFALWYVCTELL